MAAVAASRPSIPGGHAAPGSPEREEQLRRANRTEQRNGVGIDRLLGSVSGGALFDQEVVVGGRFDGQVAFRNVQLYQLALLLLVLRDLDEGFVQIGSGTSPRTSTGPTRCSIPRSNSSRRRTTSARSGQPCDHYPR